MTQGKRLLVIGAGPGGYETAVRAAKAGMEVVIVEKGHLGGTCLNAGCIPTKCLCHTAQVLQETRRAAANGVTTGEVQFSLPVAMQRKEQVLETLRNGVAALMKTPGITLLKGEARFVDAHTVDVLADGQPAQRVETDYTIIATGSVTKFLPIEGAHAEGVLTSTEMLHLQDVPRRLCIIGGGVIGLEFASVFNSFGSEVHVVEFCKEIVPNFDRDLAKRLRTALKKQGIQFHVGAAAQAIHPGTPMTVDYEEKGKTQSVEIDLVLMAVGRAANVDSLNLADVGIAFTPRGIQVDENMQTNIPGIYAVGDVNGLCQLAHAASAQGRVALNHVLQKENNERLDIVPAVVFTEPEAAMVGATEEQLTEQGIAYEAHKAFYRSNGKALSMDAEEGIVKLLAAPDGTLLGAHILGAHAGDLIHEAALIMRMGGSIDDIAHTIHAHPSLSEIVQKATV